MQDIDPKHRKWGIALGVAVVAIALVDLVALKGDSVGGGTLSLGSDARPITLTITRAAEEHLVEIRTTKRVRGERTGRSIAYRLVDPDGVTLVEDSELLSHKKRFFSFRPTQPGEYELYAEETLVLGSGTGTAHVSVTVDDRRVISRLLGF